MDSEEISKLIKTLSSLVFEVKKISNSKIKELDVKDNEKYQLQRIADELSDIRFILEEMNQNR